MRKIVAALIFILIIFSFFYQYKKGKPAAQVAQATSEVTPKPEVKDAGSKQDLEQPDSEKPAPEKDLFSIHEGDIVLGNRDSKVVIVEYSALTCPHCAYYHRDVYPELKKKYIDTNKIAYVIREFVSNKQDLDGAILSRCLADPNDPVKLLNILYTQQESWAFNKNYREILENIGQLAGISKEKYAECLARSDWVKDLADNSRSITFYKEFVGTPAFVVNGQMYKGNYDVANLSKSIDAALEGK